MATHSSILAWKIPWTEEPGRLWYMGLQRVRHDWVHIHTHSLYLHNKLSSFYTCKKWDPGRLSNLSNFKHPEYIPRPDSKTNILSTIPHCLSETREQGSAPCSNVHLSQGDLPHESNPRLEKWKLTATIFDCRGALTFSKTLFYNKLSLNVYKHRVFCCVTGAFSSSNIFFSHSFICFCTKCCVGIWVSSLWALTSLRNRHRKQEGIEVYLLLYKLWGSY